MIKLKKILLICIPIIIVFILSFKNASYGYKTEDLKIGDVLIGDEIYNGYIDPNQIVSSAINHYMKWKNERLTIYKYDGEDLIKDHKWLFLQDNNQYRELSKEEINELELKRYIYETTKKLDLMSNEEIEEKVTLKVNDKYYIYANDIKKLGVLSTKNIYGYFVYKDKEIIDNKLIMCDEYFFQKKGYITYEDFYAAGDGETNDSYAIYNAHECANKLNLPIKTAKKTYYISHMPKINGTIRTIKIKTDVDWNNSTIIIDDRNISSVEKMSNIFEVNSVRTIGDPKNVMELNIPAKSKKIPEVYNYIKSLNKTYKNWYVGLISKNDYIYRMNNDGTIFQKLQKSDYVRLDSYGNVLDDIRYDYKGETIVTAYAIPDDTLTIKNANIITKAIPCISEKSISCTETYRAFRIARSNIKMDNINHYVEDDDMPTNYPNGFLTLLNVVDFSLTNSNFRPHVYQKTSYTGSVSPYDIFMSNTNVTLFDNVGYTCNNGESVEDCYYKNMIDENRWGVTGNNNVRNWTIKNSKLNRVDSHMPGQNISIDSSILGVHAIRITGKGILDVTNVSIDSSDHVVSLRGDYGSTWNGNILMDNIYINTRDYKGKYPTYPRVLSLYLNEDFNGDKGFGYPIYIPSLDVKNIFVDEKNLIDSYYKYNGSVYNSSLGLILIQNHYINQTNLLENEKKIQAPTFVGNMKFNNLRSITFDKLSVGKVFMGNTINFEYITKSNGVPKVLIGWGMERFHSNFYKNTKPIDILVDTSSLSQKIYTSFYKNPYYVRDGENLIEKSGGDNAVNIISNDTSHLYCVINVNVEKVDDWYKDDVISATLEVPEGFNITDYGIGYSTSSYNKSYHLEIPSSKKGVFNLYGYVTDDVGNKYNCIKLVKKS